MNKNYARINKIKQMLIKKHHKSFKFNDDQEIIKIRKNLFTENILYFLLKKEKINKIFLNKNNKQKWLKKSKLIDIILKNIPTSRGVHPFIFFLFYQELIDKGIEYKYLENIDTFEIRSKKIKIREQIQESFKIIEKLFSDSNLKKMSPLLFNSLLKTNGIQIEEKIKTGLNRVQYRYIDLTLTLNESTKVYLEVNEYHHNKELDLERSLEIYLKNNTLPVLIYKEDETISEVMKNLWKEIAYGLYDDSKEEALIIYLHKIDGLNLDLAKFFINLKIKLMDNNQGVPLKYISKFVKIKGFKNFYTFVEKMIKSGDLVSEDHFIDLNLEDLKKSSLNNNGLDTLMMLPRKSDWPVSIEVKNSYSDFKDNYVNLLEGIMSSNLERIRILKESCLNFKSLSMLSDSAFDLNQRIIESNKELIEEKLDIKLHPKIWCFKYQKGERIPFYELEKIFNKKVIEYIKLNNETKKNILNYKIIESNQLNQMIDIILNSKYSEEISDESDEEELNL